MSVKMTPSVKKIIELGGTPHEYHDPYPGKADTDLVELVCGRCGGSGNVGIKWVENGICFACDGDGGRYTVTVAKERKRERERVNRANQALAKALKDQRAKETAREAFLADNPGLAQALEIGTDFAESLKDQLEARGSLTDRQVAAITRIAAERAAEAARPVVPVVEGRGVITGQVIGVKEELNSFAYRESYDLKMTVADDRGFRVYGTVPAALTDELDCLEDLKGRRVSFTATVQTSKSALDFGYFKRPSKASLA